MLRPLVPADAAVIGRWAADPEFVRAAEWTPRSIGEYERHHRKIIQSPPPGLIRLGVLVDGELAGYVDLHGEDQNHRELGFLIGGRDRWGRGLGLQAAGAALEYGFTVLNLREIRAEASETNHRSIRILTRLGFRRLGGAPNARFVVDQLAVRRARR
ncbi:GNAT family N-acetyltransferase [Actinoplanes derwentensis]|uniref:Ribosomal-protein-alanine N-acetyltransferase n=1 Tax=Actinoplanes derwentensis TaxID=113562 RepID=A0A1H1YYW2_9ACTN|nr:GNAT family N-acetyltransferase [Actinoplanes derwentensis]SDT26651.1 ribosomal-protein-alanine N-acetyltransferase [Actinoplanes derwentensis]